MKHKLLRIVPLILFGGILGLAAAPAAFEAAGVKAENDNIVVCSNFADKGTSGSGSNVSYTYSSITVSSDGGYSTKGVLRVYSGKTLTITSNNYKISKIDFAFNSDNKETKLATTIENINALTWSHKMSAQARFDSISVTFTLSDSLVSSINVDSDTTPKSIVAGSAISYNGVKVVGTMNDASTYNVSDKCVFDPVAGTVLNNVGPQVVTVTYPSSNTPSTVGGGDLTTTFTVSVTQGEKENIFTKVDSISNGDKVIIANSAEKRAATNIDDACLKTAAITIDGDNAKFTDSDGITVFEVIENSDNTYSFKNSSNKYLGVTGSRDDSKVVTFSSTLDKKTSWILDGTSLKNCYSTTYSKIYLQYNSSTHDFRMYGKTQTDVEFYKYSSGAEKILVQSTASVLEESSITITSTAQGFTPSSYLWSVSDAETLQIVGDNNKQSVTIKGLKPGSANLTIKADDDDDLTATCVVTVIAKKDAVIENGDYFIADYSDSHILNFNLEDVVGPDYGDSSMMWSIQNNGIDGDTYTISNGSSYLYHSGDETKSSLGLTSDSSHYWLAEKIEDGVYYLSDSVTGNKLSCNPATNKTWYAYDNPTGNQAKIKLFKAGELIDFSVTGPTKKTYYVGEELSTTNLKVIANFNNGAHPDVTDKVIWDELVAGTQATGTFTSGGDAYVVKVNGLSILGPVEGTMTVEGLKDTYLIGEMPERSIGNVKVTYSDGTNEEIKVLDDTDIKVSPDKVNSDTTKITVSMIDFPEIKVEKEITPEHAKYFATNMIEIGDKVTLGTTVGAEGGNITGGHEIAKVDGELNSQPFGYLPNPAMEFEVVQGVSAGTYAFKYNDKYLTSNGKTLDFGHVSNITGYKNENNTWSFDYPFMIPGQSEPYYVTLNEDPYNLGDFYGTAAEYSRNAWINATATMDENNILINFDLYQPWTATEPTSSDVLLDYEINGSLVIYLPSEQSINEKNSFTCTYVESQNDWVDDYWEICPVNEPEKHVYLNGDSCKFGVSTNADYDIMLYRDMTRDFSHEIKSLSVSIPEDMPTTVELGEPYNWVGITVKAKYDNTTKKLPLGAYEVDVPASDTYGDKTCTVTYGTSGNKVTATFKFTVVGGYQPFIKQNTYEVWVDDTNTFTTTEPAPDGEPVTWSSSDPTVANFEDPHVGDLTSYKSGKVTITVTSYDGYYSDSKELTVSQRPTGLTLDTTEKTIKQGEKFTITGTVSPSDAKNKTVLWSSSDTDIATVNSKGEVTGLGIGDVIITGQTQGKGTGEEEGYKATCTVHVEQGEVVRVTGVSLDCEYKELKPGDTFQLNAIVNPINATNKNVTWESNAPHLADVNNNGKVTVKASADTGKTVYITCKTEDGGFTARCEIKIKASVTPVPVSSISLDITSKKIDVDETFEIVATVLPNNADDKGHINWTSSDDSVVEIVSYTSSSITVKGVSEGTATITATCGGKTATCKVTVGDQPTPPPTPVHKVESVSIQIDGKDADTKTIDIQETVDLTALINPSNADNKKVVWSSSNSDVATINSLGQVTAVAAGTAKITVKTVDGNKTDIITIKVVDKEAQAKNVAIVAGVGGGAVAVGVGCGVGIPLGLRARKRKFKK